MKVTLQDLLASTIAIATCAVQVVYRKPKFFLPVDVGMISCVPCMFFWCRLFFFFLNVLCKVLGGFFFSKDLFVLKSELAKIGPGLCQALEIHLVFRDLSN